MMNSFSGIASAPNLAAAPETPARDAASSNPPSADRIHRLAITTAPPIMHSTATGAEANKARIALLTTTRMKLVRWIDAIVGIDHENVIKRRIFPRRELSVWRPLLRDSGTVRWFRVRAENARRPRLFHRARPRTQLHWPSTVC